MVAATIEELADDLDDSFQWRRLELAQVRTDVERLSNRAQSPPRDRMVLRSAVLLLYAHWEGFVREACQGYLDFVAKRRLAYRELSEPFLRLTLVKMANAVAMDTSVAERLASVVRDSGRGRAQIPRRGVVDTKANLRYDVAVEILRCLGLPLGVIETRAHLIDRKLCDARNAIAHGKTTFPLADDVLELHRQVLEMMEHVRTVVLAEATERGYRSEIMTGTVDDHPPT